MPQVAYPGWQPRANRSTTCRSPGTVPTRRWARGSGSPARSTSIRRPRHRRVLPASPGREDGDPRHGPDRYRGPSSSESVVLRIDQNPDVPPEVSAQANIEPGTGHGLARVLERQSRTGSRTHRLAVGAGCPGWTRHRRLDPRDVRRAPAGQGRIGRNRLDPETEHSPGTCMRCSLATMGRGTRRHDVRGTHEREEPWS